MARQERPYSRLEELIEINTRNKAPKKITPLRISSFASGGNLTTSELSFTRLQEILVDKTFMLFF